jgi:hypothetical protein
MDADEIRKFCHAEPFRTFAMKLRDGRTVVVEDPYATAFPPDGQRIYVGHPDESTEFVRFDDVVSVHYVSRRGARVDARRGRKAS